MISDFIPCSETLPNIATTLDSWIWHGIMVNKELQLHVRAFPIVSNFTNKYNDIVTVKCYSLSLGTLICTLSFYAVIAGMS